MESYDLKKKKSLYADFSTLFQLEWFNDIRKLYYATLFYYYSLIGFWTHDYQINKN